MAPPSVLAPNPLNTTKRGERAKEREGTNARTRQNVCNWILRVEAEHRTCKRAEVRQLGAEEAETDGLDKEDTRRSAGQHKHAMHHNEHTLWGHQERVEDGREPEERRDELCLHQQNPAGAPAAGGS